MHLHRRFEPHSPWLVRSAGLDFRTPPVRNVPRIKASLTFHLPDGWRGEVLDLSATGLRIRSVAVVPTGLEFEGTLVLQDGNIITLPVRAVWCRAPDLAAVVPGEVGFELIAPPPAYYAAVARLFADASDETAS